MENFYSLGLPEALLSSLDAMNYKTPTPIQAETIHLALKGHDILGTAQTGTGKTAAFAIPIVVNLMSGEKNNALVLTPTRELAMQVEKLLNQLIDRKSNIRTALIIGGDSIEKQLNQLKSNPRIIVGTPGRISDHLKRGSLKLNNSRFLVLDEIDRMLDMGFSIQLAEIAKFLPKERQTLMFSATLPKSIQDLTTQYLKDPIRVSVGSTIDAATTIKQEIIKTSESEKHNILLDQLNLRSGTCIIFVKTKMATESLAKTLREHGHSANAIHGDLRQRNRDKVMRAFRSKKHRILVATDIAARGLDIPHIEHVVNYDLPQCEEDFIHRIGRTGRAGNTGSAVSIITPKDAKKWQSIDRMMNPSSYKKQSEDSTSKIRNTRRAFFKHSEDSFARPKTNRNPRATQSESFAGKSQNNRSSFSKRSEDSFARPKTNRFSHDTKSESFASKSEDNRNSFSKRSEDSFARPKANRFSPAIKSESFAPKSQNKRSAFSKQTEGFNEKPRVERAPSKKIFLDDKKSSFSHKRSGSSTEFNSSKRKSLADFNKPRAARKSNRNHAKKAY